MKPKKIYYEKDGRQRLLAGVDKLADAVRITIGPRGRAVCYKDGVPKWTLDGVTVANHIELSDEVESMGAESVKQAANRANDESGDGTSAATVLSQSMIKEGVVGVAAGIDPVKMKRGMETAAQVVLDALKVEAKPIKKMNEVENVATISSRDREIGQVVARVYDKVGKDGVVTVEESKTVGLFDEVVKGMRIDTGWISQYFITDGEKLEAVLEKPRILVTSQTLTMNDDIVKVLQEVINTDSRSLLIIADDVTGEALTTTVLNKLRKTMKVACIKAPSYGDNKKEMLEDIALLTGAQFFSEELNKKVEDAKLEDLGECDRVVVGRYKTVLVGSKGDKDEIAKRIKGLKAQADKEESDFRRKTLTDRFAKLSEGVAVIKVGSVSESEQREKVDRIDDAVHAAKSALEEGVVIGGGLALVRASALLQKLADASVDMSERYGIEMVRRACRQPAAQVITNTGESADVILERISKAQEKNRNAGWNAETGEMEEDMIKAGVIDPAKVVRVAFESAVSVAGTFLITGAVLVDEPEPKKEAPKQQ